MQDNPANQPENNPNLSLSELNRSDKRRNKSGNPFGFILGSIALFFAAFFLGIIFTIYMTTHAFEDGIIKEIQKPILTASGIPAEAHLQWLDLEGALANVDRFFYGRDKIDHKKMVWTAAEAAIHALNDPFTIFRQPEQAQSDRDSLEARRIAGAIGVYPAIRNGQLVFYQLVPGGPAEKAGVRENDVIIKINGSPVVLSGDSGKDLEKLSGQMRGEVGSQVTLTLQRPSDNNRTLDVTITRANVEIPPVITRLLGDNKDVGYISVTTFGPNTIKQFDDKVAELEKANVTSYVLDLRGNGGGLIDVAQRLIGRFLEGGVAYYRNVPYQNLFNEPQNVINDKDGLKLYNKPLVVLVNGGTASASEITAGALQDRNRAALIGEKTYGKGVAQYVLDLPSKASVRITFEQWLTPNKINLSDTKGIRPNIEVKNSQEDVNAGRDSQLDRAIKFLQNREAAPPAPPATK